MTSGDDGPDVPRFWCPSEGSYQVDADGYLADPQADKNCVLATGQLFAYRCLVLLGEPGAGKTRTVDTHAPFLPPEAGLMPVVRRDLGLYGSEERLVADLLECAEVRRWRDGVGDLCLLLDGFDEAQARIPTLARLFSHYIGQWPAGRLYLRITCRTAEWPPTLATAMKNAYGSVGTFELLPLRRTDVKAFLPAEVDPAVFLKAVSGAHAVPLAVRPLILTLLARLFTQENGFPDRVADLYGRGLLSLCDEQNPGRRDSGAIGSLPPAARLGACRRIAAVSVFGGRPAIWTGPAVRGGGDMCVNADDCCGGGERWDEFRVELTPQAVREALRTGLFTGRGAQQLGWAHASFAEYLAADWVVSNDLSEDQVRSLFFAADGRIYPQLRSAAAWTVAIAPGRHGWMAAEDPESFLGQVSIPDDALRATVLDGAFHAAAEDRLRADSTAGYRDLSHVGLAGQLRRRLQDEHHAVRVLAIKVAEQCRVVDLAPELVAIALDPAASVRDRVPAVRAVGALLPGTDALLPLIRDAAVLGDDPDDEVLGMALLASWPHGLPTGDALAVMRLPKRRNLLGHYRMFMESLRRSLGEEDLQRASSWLVAVGDDADDQLLERFSGSVLRLMAGHLDDQDVFRCFREVVLRRARNRRPVLGRGPDQAQVQLPERDRRMLVLSLITEGDDLAFALVSNIYGPALVGPADLPWLIDQYTATPPGGRPALARIFLLTYQISNPAHVSAILELSDDHPLVADVVGDWRRPVTLDSDDAKRMRIEWERLNRQAVGEQRVDDNEIDQQISRQVDAALAGDTASFWQAARLVTVQPGTNRYVSEFQPDLTAHPRWERLDQGLRGRIVQAAELYLQVGQCSPDRWLGQPIAFFPAQAGYRALLLLARLNPAALSGLDRRVWREWAPAIIGWPATTNGASWDDKLLLLQQARVHSDAELRDALVQIIRACASRGERLLMWWQDCNVLWCQQLADELISVAAEEALPPESRDDLLEVLAVNDPDRARPFLQTWLQPKAIQQDRDRATQAAAVLLVKGGAAAWPGVYQLLRDDPELGKEVILAAASRDESPLQDLAPHQLADLYCWLSEHFTAAQDPEMNHARRVGAHDQVRHWRDAIPRILEKTGTTQAVQAMRRIVSTFPADPWLKMRLAVVEEASRSAQWTPVPLGQLRRLAADHRVRLVRSPEELLRTIVAALEVVQRRLQADTPEAQLLWDTRVQRPKTEEEASDYLRQRLNDLIGGRGAMANREVQVRRIQPTGIPERTDLRIDAPASDPHTGETPILTVVGEVKAAWNTELDTAMRTQLAGRYMLDTGTTHGLYVVLWFDTGRWKPDQGTSDRNRVARLNRAEVLQNLRRQAATLVEDGFHVEVIMLDMSYERPAREAS